VNRSVLRRALPLLSILLLAMALRFYQLDGQSLWADEGNSAALAVRSLGRIARDAGRDIHPPLYYWLLHLWVRVVGTGEAGLRSLSAFSGVALVMLTYLLGARLSGRLVGLAAGFVAAVSPFQVCYSQEARMYILVALLGTATMYALLRYLESESLSWLACLILGIVAGLYTHYLFLTMWGIANLAWLVWTFSDPARRRSTRWISTWLIALLIIAAMYTPWIPIAYRQLRAWPAISQARGLRFYLHQAFQLWSLGETRPEGQGSFWLLWGMVVLWLLGAWPERIDDDQSASANLTHPISWWNRGFLLIYCLVPVLSQWGMSFLRPAYRPKFFLVAAPAYAVVLGQGVVHGLHTRWWALRNAWAGLSLCLVLASSASSLSHYYTDATWARDDYRSTVAYISAVEREGDAIVLNAPGQWEVFRYYYKGETPVYPLPKERPADRETVVAALERIGDKHQRLFCLFWATDESDPSRIVEGWLDQRAYKALDLWRGNVRFLVYSLSRATTESHMSHSLGARMGDRILLQGFSLQQEAVAAGEILQLTLFWQADQHIEERYKVFLQVLDASNNIVGQRDSEPGGGMLLTTLWPVGETLTDNYGILIRPGTPPGRYRLISGLYSLTSGKRLAADGDDKITLDQISVTRPDVPPPIEAYGIQHPTEFKYASLAVLGYDVHKLGFDWRPEEPLQPGDILHLNLYWQIRQMLDTRWRLNLRLVGEGDRTWWRGEQIPLAGQSYPTTEWQLEEIVRGQYNLLIPPHASEGRYRLEGEVQPLGGGTPLLPRWRSDWLRVNE
jgi:mannosyltransferase